MLKRTITYENPDGPDITEVAYFHITLWEFQKLQKRFGGDLQGFVGDLVKKNDTEGLSEFVVELIETGYGFQDPASNRFDKNTDATRRFMVSPAFDVLYVDLLTNEGSALAFLDNIMAKEVKAAMAAQASKASIPPPPPPPTI